MPTIVILNFPFLSQQHSDDEQDWSDVDDDIYKNKKSISMKEALRRREWGAGKDAVTVAALPWPVLPRHAVAKILGTLIDECIRLDTEKYGLFSVPVPKEEFPDYYEVIKNPMDYGTMKDKLERGEYRSAQAMQKDFILVMQNCLQFNAKDSDIVKEARAQTLDRPKLLKEAALKNNFFIGEDGAVIDVDDDVKKKGGRKSKAAPLPTKPKKKGKLVACGECEGCLTKACKKCPSCKKKKRCDLRACSDVRRVYPDEVEAKKKRGGSKKDDSDESEEDEESKKPKVRIKLSAKKRKATKDDDEKDGEDAPTKKKARRSNGASKRRSNAGSDVPEDDDEPYDEMFDVEKLEEEQSELKDASFDDVRNHVTSLGPWRLPAALESEFKEVATITLSNLSKHDVYDIFKEPVSEEEVPNYSETIKNPMDFSTMKNKIEQGDYGNGSNAAAELYEDVLLTFDNCRSFNVEGEVVDEATNVFVLVPLVFAKACEEVMRSSGSSTPRGKRI